LGLDARSLLFNFLFSNSSDTIVSQRVSFSSFKSTPSQSGGQSGFAIFDAEGDARIGPKGVHLRTDTDPQAIRVTFDPRDGLAFYYDGSEMPTVRIPGVPGLGPIEAIELLTSQGATWVVEELAIESL